MYQDSPASSCVGSFGRWRWIQQNYMPQNRLRETRNGVDYVLVSKVSHAEGEEEISEDIMRYAVCMLCFCFYIDLIMIIVSDFLRV